MRGDRLDYATEQIWSTPRASDGEKGGPNQNFGAGWIPLPAQSAQWATPCARDHMPPHSEAYIAEKKAQGHGMKILSDQASQWPTPRAKEDGQYQYSRGDKSKPVETLTGASVSFHQAHPTYQVGEVFSKERRSLNPLFVEWLMGWPPGWTLLAWTDFACSATALSAWKARMRFALLQLGLPAEAAPVQHSLFG